MANLFPDQLFITIITTIIIDTFITGVTHVNRIIRIVSTISYLFTVSPRTAQPIKVFSANMTVRFGLQIGVWLTTVTQAGSVKMSVHRRIGKICCSLSVAGYLHPNFCELGRHIFNPVGKTRGRIGYWFLAIKWKFTDFLTKAFPWTAWF